jgi:hypothetical protein
MKTNRVKKASRLFCAAACISIIHAASAQTSVVNGSFETSSDGIPDGWTLVGSQPPTLINTDSENGTNCMDLAVTNTTMAANTSEIDQNTYNAGGGQANPGEVYNFSFWAKQISSDDTYYVENYQVSWLDINGAPVGGSGFISFNGGTNTWIQITLTNLVVPANAVGAYIQIYGASGGVAGSYGEVHIDNVALTLAAAPQTNQVHAFIQSGNQVSWTSISGDQDQVQWAASNNGPWTNLGGVLPGVNGTNSIFDTAKHSFYQILEITPGSSGNLVLDPDFAIPAANAIGAVDWNILANAGATIVATNSSTPSPYVGSYDLYIESTVPAGGGPAPNSDVRSDLIPVTAGTTYNLSFYAANPVEIGGANPQYDIFFYDTNSNPVGGPIFTSFSSVGATWTQVTGTVTPPAGATQLTIGWIQAVGAGAGSDWVTLIDDVSLSSGIGSSRSTNVLAATTQSGVQVSWASTNGSTYQAQSVTELGMSWAALGTTVPGNGTTNMVFDGPLGSQKFYRVLQLP